MKGLLDAVSKDIANLCVDVRNAAVALLDDAVSAASKMWLLCSRLHAHSLGYTVEVKNLIDGRSCVTRCGPRRCQKSWEWRSTAPPGRTLD